MEWSVLPHRQIGEASPLQPRPDEEGTPAPPAVTAWRRALADSDGVLVSCPEYAHGVPGRSKTHSTDRLQRGDHRQAAGPADGLAERRRERVDRAGADAAGDGSGPRVRGLAGVRAPSSRRRRPARRLGQLEAEVRGALAALERAIALRARLSPGFRPSRCGRAPRTRSKRPRPPRCRSRRDRRGAARCAAR